MLGKARISISIKVSELSHSQWGLQLLTVLQHILKCSPSIFCCWKYLGLNYSEFLKPRISLTRVRRCFSNSSGKPFSILRFCFCCAVELGISFQHLGCWAGGSSGWTPSPSQCAAQGRRRTSGGTKWLRRCPDCLQSVLDNLGPRDTPRQCEVALADLQH